MRSTFSGMLSAPGIATSPSSSGNRTSSHTAPASTSRPASSYPTALRAGLRMSSMKSDLVSRCSTPSVSIVTLALRRASETSASSPKLSPSRSSASSISLPVFGALRVMRHRPDWMT